MAESAAEAIVEFGECGGHAGAFKDSRGIRLLGDGGERRDQCNREQDWFEIHGVRMMKSLGSTSIGTVSFKKASLKVMDFLNHVLLGLDDPGWGELDVLHTTPVEIPHESPQAVK